MHSETVIHGDSRYTVNYGLKWLQGNAKPYFTFSFQQASRSRRGVWIDVGGGSDPVVIAEHFPHLKPFLPLHLGDIDGKPMHAVENAKYWAGFSRYQERDVAMLARHLRQPEDHMEFVMEAVGDDPSKLEEYIRHSLEEEWYGHALECIAILKLEIPADPNQ